MASVAALALGAFLASIAVAALLYEVAERPYYLWRRRGTPRRTR
jgi:peptidoglycan/LPS O-acetylase OafA/YrhL